MKEETIQRQLEEATREIERQHREEEERLRAMRQLAEGERAEKEQAMRAQLDDGTKQLEQLRQQELKRQVVHSGSVNQCNERQQRTPKLRWRITTIPLFFTNQF